MARRLCLSVFPPPLLLQQDLPHQASQGAGPVVSWPFSELGYLEGSFRDEASFLAFRRLCNFWTRHPGTAEGVCCAVLLALWFCASTSTLLQEGPGSPALFMQSASETTPLPKGRVDCHRLRQNQCDRVPPSLLKAFCAALLLSCQRLGTSQTRERMGATLRLATCQHPPNAGPDVHPGTLLLWGALEGLGRLSSLAGKPFELRLGQKSRPTSSVPIRCLRWYGSTSHLGTVAKRTLRLCYGCRATATAPRLMFVTVLLPTGSSSARSDGSRALTTNHPYGPSLVVRSYLVWDATRRELWETAFRSTTRRLPIREYWTQ